jgi:hypothetical protein
MALWQFTVIAVLMGALLVHTSFLTLKPGRASAALKRIEAALLSKGEVVTPAPTAPVEATQPLEPTDMEESIARYLTIRDLKVRSERRRSLATASLESPAAPDISGRFAGLLFGRDKNERPDAASSESSDAPNTSTEATNTSSEAPATSTEMPSFHASQAAIGNSVTGENGSALALSTESADALSVSIEPPAHACQSESEHPVAASLHASLGENENSVPPSAETGDAPNTSAEPPHSPAAVPTTNEDSVEQREREALLFQSNQRRRRRARQGY